MWKCNTNDARCSSLFLSQLSNCSWLFITIYFYPEAYIIHNPNLYIWLKKYCWHSIILLQFFSFVNYRMYIEQDYINLNIAGFGEIKLLLMWTKVHKVDYWSWICRFLVSINILGYFSSFFKLYFVVMFWEGINFFQM